MDPSLSSDAAGKKKQKLGEAKPNLCALQKMNLFLRATYTVKTILVPIPEFLGCYQPRTYWEKQQLSVKPSIIGDVGARPLCTQ